MHLPSWEFIDIRIVLAPTRDERGLLAPQPRRGTRSPDLLTLGVFRPCKHLRNLRIVVKSSCGREVTSPSAAPAATAARPPSVTGDVSPGATREDGGKLGKGRAALKIHLCTRTWCIFGRFII